MTQQRCASYYTASIAEESDYPRLEGEHQSSKSSMAKSPP